MFFYGPRCIYNESLLHLREYLELTNSFNVIEHRCHTFMYRLWEDSRFLPLCNVYYLQFVLFCILRLVFVFCVQYVYVCSYLAAFVQNKLYIMKQHHQELMCMCIDVIEFSLLVFVIGQLVTGYSYWLVSYYQLVQFQFQYFVSLASSHFSYQYSYYQLHTHTHSHTHIVLVFWPSFPFSISYR